MSIATELERIEGLRNELRIHLIGMNLAGADDDLEACVRALQTVDSYGYALSTITEADQSISIEAGYYPEGSIVAINPYEADKIIPANIRDGVTILGVEGTFTSDATATATDILEGQTAYIGGGKITGTLKKQAKTVTPTKEVQSIMADLGTVFSAIMVGAIPASYFDISGTTAAAENVLEGTKFITSDGELTEGTMKTISAAQTVLDTETLSYTIPEGYHDGSGTVSIVTETDSAVALKNVSRTFRPSEGKVFSSFTVEPIPSMYHDVSKTTLAAEYALAGYRFVTADGETAYGTMYNRGKVKATIDGLETTSYTIPEGYHSGLGTVSLTDDIEAALAGI